MSIADNANIVERYDLDRDEIERYSRHLLVPGVGLQGQRRLRAASVLVVGAGGLGSPAALYLAAAGVGRLGLADHDPVELSNLQRQVLHSTPAIGTPKVESARRRLEELNPKIEIETYGVALDSSNALDIVARYDLVVDGTDNFPTRYLLNDTCVMLGKPLVYGSIFRWEGQVSLFWAARGGPCYRCLYPQPPAPGLVPTCAEGGVLGVLPGTIGTLQATEALKVLLEAGEILVGRLLLYDALRSEFREVRFERDAACPVCGDQPTITELIDYEAFCGLGATPHGAADEIEPLELNAWLGRSDAPVIVDVREPGEWALARIEGARLVPLATLAERAHELSTADEIVLVCKTGSRSARGAFILRELGFGKVRNLRGGLDAWARDVEPEMVRY